MTRTRTPPDLKFLLNERAALAGATSVVDRNIRVLEARVRAAETKLAARKRQLELLQASREANLQQLRALDVTLAATHPCVDPLAVAPLNAWVAPGGRRRGDLKRLVLGALRSAAPTPLPTSVLVAPAAAAFGWPLTAPEERAKAARIVRRVLQRASSTGLVDSLHPAVTGQEGSWRWKDREPGASDLLALGGHEQDENAAGAEVGGQRVGGRYG